jgi:hypothetical protein
VLAAGLLVAGAAWIVVNRGPATPSDPITRAACDRIQAGMSRAQVEGFLGRKADHVLTIGGRELEHEWIGRDGFISVAFDDDGLVVSRMFTATGGRLHW